MRLFKRRSEIRRLPIEAQSAIVSARLDAEPGADAWTLKDELDQEKAAELWRPRMTSPRMYRPGVMGNLFRPLVEDPPGGTKDPTDT